MMNGEIRIKDIAKVLTLFFALAVISLVLVYSNFERKIDEAWQDSSIGVDIFENEEFCQLIDLDNYEMAGGVYEFDREELIFDYEESGGTLDVFGTVMDELLKGA